MKKIVVKIGSSILAPGGVLDKKFLKNIIRDIVAASEKGKKIIIITSGAIACGMRELGYRRRPTDLASLMSLASLGQIILMDNYEEVLRDYKKRCAQVLLTWDDFDNRQRFLNARNTINRLLSWGIIPIINENDAVSYKEIRFGDNDRLSALVADLVQSDLLVILSNVEGLLDKDKLIKKVEKIDEEIFKLAKKEDKIFTSGGMFTKLEAASIATSSGIKTIIAHGRKKNILNNILEGKEEGTLFLPLNKNKIKARKRWIAFSKKIKGIVYIDKGAEEAILNRGKSLLLVGVKKVEGEFIRSDAVKVKNEQGKDIGSGIVNYSHQEIERYLKNKKLEAFDKELIHRDNFVLR